MSTTLEFLWGQSMSFVVDNVAAGVFITDSEGPIAADSISFNSKHKNTSCALFYLPNDISGWTNPSVCGRQYDFYHKIAHRIQLGKIYWSPPEWFINGNYQFIDSFRNSKLYQLHKLPFKIVFWLGTPVWAIEDICPDKFYLALKCFWKHLKVILRRKLYLRKTFPVFPETPAASRFPDAFVSPTRDSPHPTNKPPTKRKKKMHTTHAMLFMESPADQVSLACVNCSCCSIVSEVSVK